MTLKNRLKVARVTNGDLTQQQLADRVSCSRQTIHSIESAKFIPSVELSLKIAQALGVPIDQIFYLSDSED
jgi:putative transcriptional regulator